MGSRMSQKRAGKKEGEKLETGEGKERVKEKENKA